MPMRRPTRDFRESTRHDDIAHYLIARRAHRKGSLICPGGTLRTPARAASGHWGEDRQKADDLACSPMPNQMIEGR
jgi:hypothetical protein